MIRVRILENNFLASEELVPLGRNPFEGNTAIQTSSCVSLDSRAIDSHREIEPEEKRADASFSPFFFSSTSFLPRLRRLKINRSF